MKPQLIYISLLFILFGCQSDKNQLTIPQNNFDLRETKIHPNDEQLFLGKTYLPIYSHIYHFDHKNTYELTVTVSLRNISMTDTAYITTADYYNTRGDKIREYIKKPIYLNPMETVEIIIDARDQEGGSGANFIFNWAIENEANAPLFEAVMISTQGQQGLSFTSRGQRVYD